jgi:hypothetical protein
MPSVTAPKRPALRLYLDTADLINLLERGLAGISLDEFRSFLLKGGYAIVLSFQTICELMAPLWEPGSTTVVTKTMNKLEDLPHEWIDLVRLPNIELAEALRAVKEGATGSARGTFSRTPPPHLTLSLRKTGLNSRAVLMSGSWEALSRMIFVKH